MKIGIVLLYWLLLCSEPLVAQYANSSFYFSGSSILGLSNNLFDLQKEHYRLLAYQGMQDQLLTYFSFMNRTAPGNFIIDDQTYVKGSLNRTILSFGTHFGRKNGVFFGLEQDLVNTRAQNFLYELPLPNNVSWSSEMGQFYAFGGVKIQKVQLSAGVLVGQGLSGINKRGEFSVRPLKDISFGVNKVMSLYVDPGIFISVATNNQNVYDLQQDALVEQNNGFMYSTRIQPQWNFLPAYLGLPYLNFDQLKQVTGFFTSIKNNTIDKLSQDQRLIGIGSEDIVLLQNYPNLRFKTELTYNVMKHLNYNRFEFSGRWRIASLFEIGSRFISYRLGVDLERSSETYIQFGSPWGAHYTLSHSFNSPDRTTFLPVRGIHVFGFKIAYGIPELTRPLIPMITRIKKQFDD
jgi:hypothetical protein